MRPCVRIASILFASAALAASCSRPPVDLAKTLQVAELTAGWYDAGVVEGYKNKLVPSLSFRLKNAGEPIDGSVQLNAVFRRLGDSEELGSSFTRGIDSNGLAPGASTDPIVLRSTFGYTGSEPRSQMLQNRLFVDVKVQLFAKYGASQWTLLGEYPIPRVLLTK
jgi:hypothetical protein